MFAETPFRNFVVSHCTYIFHTAGIIQQYLADNIEKDVSITTTIVKYMGNLRTCFGRNGSSSGNTYIKILRRTTAT